VLETCRSIASILASSYGPAGRDKLILLPDGHMTVSNDGATILSNMHTTDPVAALLVHSSRAQEWLGDGTTGVVLLAVALLHHAVELLEDGIPLPDICDGFRACLSDALSILQNLVIASAAKELSTDKERLMQAIGVSLSSKIAGANDTDRLHLSHLILDALQSGQRKPEYILCADGSSLTDSFVHRGVCFRRPFTFAGHAQMPTRLEFPNVLLLDVELEYKHQKEFAHIEVSQSDAYLDYVDAEWGVFQSIMDWVLSSGAAVVLSSQQIGDAATQMFARRGVFAAGRVARAQMQRIQRITGGVIYASTVGEGMILGKLDLFEQRNLNGEPYLFFGNHSTNTVHVGVQNSVCILRGGTVHMLEEVKRSLDDAWEVGRTLMLGDELVCGACACEMFVSSVMQWHAMSLSDCVSDKRRRCLSAFSDSLFDIAACLACTCATENPIELVTQVRALYFQAFRDNCTDSRRSVDIARHFSCWGINVEEGAVANAKQMGVVEPFSMKKSMYSLAVETCLALLCIDAVLVSD
jgi:T-complex protein 1 subunit eta